MSSNKKIVYGLGFMCTLAIPIVSIVSCGDNTDSEDQEKDQEKLNGITQEQVKTALSIEDGALSKMASSAGIADDVNPKSINGLEGTSLRVINWVHDDALGEITFNVSILKSSLTTKTMDMKITGFNIDQGKINSITVEQIKDAYPLLVPDSARLPSTITPLVNQINIEINTVTNVDIAINNWSAKNATGQITFTAVVSKVGFHPKDIDVMYDKFDEKNPTVDAKKLEAIDAQHIIAALNVQDSDPSILASTAPDINSVSSIDIGGLTAVSIDVLNLAKTDAAGTISFDVTLKSNALETKIIGITISGYMVELTSANKTTLSSIDPITKKMTIFQKVTKIANGAFQNADIKNLVFESNSKLVTIGQYAFDNVGIRGGEIIFPNSLETIEQFAFESSAFDSIKFGAKLKSIGLYGFRDRNSVLGLKSLRFPATFNFARSGSFQSYAIEILTFDGDIPPQNGRQIHLSRDTFYHTSIDAIQDQAWHSWAQTLGNHVFKT